MSSLGIALPYGRSTDPPLIGRFAALFRDEIYLGGNRRTDHPDTAYAFCALRFELDQVNPERLLNGIRFNGEASFGLYCHLMNVKKLAEYLAIDSAIPTDALIEIGIAGSLHDVVKPRYPNIFFQGIKRKDMTSEQRAVVDGHPIDCAEIARRAGHPNAARLIVTMCTLNTRHMDKINLRDIIPFPKNSDEYYAAQLLETADHALAMREVGAHRPYRDKPMSFDEIRTKLPEQVRAPKELIDRAMHYLEGTSPA